MLQCWDQTRNARPADFPGKSSSIQVRIHYLPQISTAQRSILAILLPSIPLEGHSNLSPLSSPEFGGGIAAARYLLWQPVPFIVRATAPCHCQRPPHKVRVRLVLFRLRPVHRGFQRCKAEIKLCLSWEWSESSNLPLFLVQVFGT